MQVMELTPKQIKQWEDTMSLMAWTCPGFRHIFYKLLSNNKGRYIAVPTPDVPIAATDAKNILINPDTFFGYDLQERVFAVAHEIVHNMYGDVELLHRCKTANLVPTNSGKSLPFRMEAMQHAMDYRINALLRDAKIGKLIKGVMLDDQHKANDSVLDIYERIYEDYPEGGDGGFPGDVLAPGESTGQDPATHSRNPGQWAVETKTAEMLEKMRSRGDISGALKRMFQEILEPEVPWTEHIRSSIHRNTGTGTYSWRRPDRRHIVRDLYMPSRTGFGAGRIAVWADTSGSIQAQEICAYLAELGSILDEVKPEQIDVYWCDAEIKQIDHLSDPDDLNEIRFTGRMGGGGTDVKPVFDALSMELTNPELFIGFTDGYVPFPRMAPPYPVIWASTTKDVQYPWGEVVHINQIAKRAA